MTDIADAAALTVEQAEAAALAASRATLRTRPLEPCGVCYCCNEPLHFVGALYCDSDCAGDHALAQRRLTGKRV